jgi:hypothetical protein
LAGDAGGDVRDERIGGGADLQNGAIRGGRPGGEACRADPEGKLAVRQSDYPLAPDLVLPDELPDRQRIKEFVGDKEKGALRHLLEAVVPGDGRGE